MTADTLDARSILGPDGTIAARLAHFEHRGEQLEMASAVSKAIRKKQHLIVEAGTGVGKSFGYLVPAILAVTDDTREDRPKRILISTHTISLQEQLLHKDVPFLNSMIPREFSCVLGKGRRNYLSLRRLELAERRAAGLFFQDEHLDQLHTIGHWSRETNDGSQSDLPSVPHPTVWDEVASDHANCMGRKCDTHEKCFYYAARRRLQNAQILIVNHALFFTDLAMRAQKFGILPDYNVVIFDEAHTVPHAAREYLGRAVSSGQVEFALSRLYNERTNRGLLVHQKWEEGQRGVVQVRKVAKHFFETIEDWQRGQSTDTGRVREKEIVENRLTPVIDELAESVLAFAKKRKDDSERQDYLSAGRRLQALAADVNAWLIQEDTGSVHWIEQSSGRTGRTRIELRAAPVDIGPVLRQHLFDKVDSVIMTSATLATGREGNFEYFKRLIGLTHCPCKMLGSPFDYQQQVELAVLKGMPDPTSDPDEYSRMCASVIQRYVQRYDGRTFALFTSYKMLKDVASRLTPWLTEQDMQLYSQADGAPRNRLLEDFRSNPRGILLGTDSFWQGVDVPGDALKCVIITRLPFSVPDHPLLQAQLEHIRQQGGEPFFDYQVPEAIIKLRQGFGRLVRSRRDTGTVVILDPRVVTKRYGQLFVQALPECTVVEDYAVGTAFE